MTLTAKDIQSQQFHVRFRGFDVEEVDDFLEKLAAEMETINQENSKLKNRLADLEKELAAYQSQEKSFQAAIIAAQKIVDEMKDKSRLEAEKTIVRAREEAAKLQQDANREVAGLEGEVDRLKALRTQVQDEMRHLLQTYLAQLESTPAEGIHQDLSRVREDKAESRIVEDEQFVEDLTDDLYVKIDLPDSTLPQTFAETGPPEVKLPLMPDTDFLDMEEGEQQPAPNIPELEGDMVFSLEDPLDVETEDEDSGPAIILGDEEDEEDGRKGGR